MRGLRRAGATFAVEGRRFVAALTGYLDEPMPKDYPGAIEFARILRAPGLYELLRSTEPVSELRTMRFAASQRRRYERRRRAPRGVLVVGDALCCFNAVYGQGMTIAAREALALEETLQGGTGNLFARFQGAAAKLADIPWSVVVGGDLALDNVRGERTLATRTMNVFMQRLMKVAADDAEVSCTFLKVMHLCAPPSDLFAPSILWRTLTSKVVAVPAALSAVPSALASDQAAE